MVNDFTPSSSEHQSERKFPFHAVKNGKKLDRVKVNYLLKDEELSLEC